MRTSKSTACIFACQLLLLYSKDSYKIYQYIDVFFEEVLGEAAKVIDRHMKIKKP